MSQSHDDESFRFGILPVKVSVTVTPKFELTGTRITKFNLEHNSHSLPYLVMGTVPNTLNLTVILANFVPIEKSCNFSRNWCFSHDFILQPVPELSA